MQPKSQRARQRIALHKASFFNDARRFPCTSISHGMAMNALRYLREKLQSGKRSITPRTQRRAHAHIRRPFEKFVDSPYYSESELCGGAVTVSFSKYLPWQAMHFLQRSTRFSKTCCRPFAAKFRIVEQAVFLPRSSLFVVGKGRKSHGATSGLHGLEG
jgi:hypothetical protein